ncbi:MAG: hypothetical protein Q3976_01240 [Corynebacterium sp.]|nr:hypothetical protein [Corynebacterium sp.]
MAIYNGHSSFSGIFFILGWIPPMLNGEIRREPDTVCDWVAKHGEGQLDHEMSCTSLFVLSTPTFFLLMCDGVREERGEIQTSIAP